jgi:hypothetical protein
MSAVAAVLIVIAFCLAPVLVPRFWRWRDQRAARRADVRRLRPPLTVIPGGRSRRHYHDPN